MYLSENKFNEYLGYFNRIELHSDNEADYLVHTDTLASLLHSSKKRIERELHYFLIDRVTKSEIESRKGIYDTLFFNLPFDKRPLISDLAFQLNLPLETVQNDLRYFGLKGSDYAKTVKAADCRKSIKTEIDLINYRLKLESDVKVYNDSKLEKSDFQERVDTWGSTLIPGTSINNRVQYPNKYARLLLYEELYVSKPYEKRPLVTELAKLQNCTPEKVRQDFKLLGLYDEYLLLQKQGRLKRQFESLSVNSNISIESRCSSKLKNAKEYFEKYSDENRLIHRAVSEISKDLGICIATVYRYLSNLGYTAIKEKKAVRDSSILAFIAVAQERGQITQSNVELEQLLNCSISQIYTVLKKHNLYMTFLSLRRRG